MNNMQMMNRDFERVGWGLLAILWGVIILFDFLPFGAGLVGTGLIILGVARAKDHLSLKRDTTIFGILVLAWGGLEFARPFLRQMFPSADLDWVIFAILLIGLGLLWSASWYRPEPKKASDL